MSVMPCVCLPCGNLSRAPVESYIKVFFTFVGVLVEFIFAWEKVNKKMSGMEHNHEHAHHQANMTAVTSRVIINDNNIFNHPDGEGFEWTFDWKNGQHITM